jgi:hypothetical protein
VYQLQYWSTDSDDSEAVAAHSILIAIDRTDPTITIASVTPDVLWPPNGKFVAVTVTGIASDSLSGVNASSLGFHVSRGTRKVEDSRQAFPWLWRSGRRLSISGRPGWIR